MEVFVPEQINKPGQVDFSLLTGNKAKVYKFIMDELPKGKVISNQELRRYLMISRDAWRSVKEHPSMAEFNRKSNINSMVYWGRPEDLNKLK